MREPAPDRSEPGRVIVWLPNRDAGWALPAAEPWHLEWVEGGRRTMHELAVAVACTGRAVEFRGEMTLSALDELSAAAGAGPLLPEEPRVPRADDLVIVNEGVVDPLIYARLALSPARVALLPLGPLGLMGWSFTAEPWSPPDFATVPVDSVSRPEHFRAAAALGFELWAPSPGMKAPSEAAGVPCRFIGSGIPGGFPAPPAAYRDIDVLTVEGNRWLPLARPVIDELQQAGVRCVTAPAGAHERLMDMFGRARIFLHPSRVEGVSRLGREARAMGAVPVTLESNPFAVGLDAAGGAVAVGSVAEMAAAVTGLLADPERLARLSATGIEAARREVDWQRYVERVDAAIAAGGGGADPARPARAAIGAALREREAASEPDRAAELEAALAATRADLEQHRQWLEATTGSLSWRLTTPLRRLKRGLRRGRSAR